MLLSASKKLSSSRGQGCRPYVVTLDVVTGRPWRPSIPSHTPVNEWFCKGSGEIEECWNKSKLVYRCTHVFVAVTSYLRAISRTTLSSTRRAIMGARISTKIMGACHRSRSTSDSPQLAHSARRTPPLTRVAPCPYTTSFGRGSVDAVSGRHRRRIYIDTEAECQQQNNRRTTTCDSPYYSSTRLFACQIQHRVKNELVDGLLYIDRGDRCADIFSSSLEMALIVPPSLSVGH